MYPPETNYWASSLLVATFHLDVITQTIMAGE